MAMKKVATFRIDGVNEEVLTGENGYFTKDLFDSIWDRVPEDRKAVLADGRKVIFIDYVYEDKTGDERYAPDCLVEGDRVAKEVVRRSKGADGSLRLELSSTSFDRTFAEVNIPASDPVVSKVDTLLDRVVEATGMVSPRLASFSPYKGSAVIERVDASGNLTGSPMMYEIDTVKGIRTVADLSTKKGFGWLKGLGHVEKSTIVVIQKPDKPYEACQVIFIGKSQAEVQAKIDTGALNTFEDVQKFGGCIVDKDLIKLVESNPKHVAISYHPYTKLDKADGSIKNPAKGIPLIRRIPKNNRVKAAKCPHQTITSTYSVINEIKRDCGYIRQDPQINTEYGWQLLKDGSNTFQFNLPRVTGKALFAGALAFVSVLAIKNITATNNAISSADQANSYAKMVLAIHANPEHDEAYTYGGDQVVDGSKGAAVHNIDGQYYVTGMLSYNNLQVYTQSGTTYIDENGKEETVENTPELKALAEQIYNYTLDTEKGAGYATGAAVANVCYGKVDGLARLVGGELEFDYTMVDNYLAGEKEYITNYGAVVEEAHQGYRDGITANFEKGTTGGDSVTTDEVDTNSDEALTAATVLTGDPDGIAYIITSDYDNVIYALDTPKEDLYEITLADHFGQTEYEYAIAHGEVTDQFKSTTTQLGITAPKLVEAYGNIYTSTLKQVDVAGYRLAGHTTNVFLTEDKAYKFVGEIYATNANGMQNYELDIKRLSTASGIDNANATMNLNIPTMSFYNVGDYTHIDSTVAAPEEERSH